MLGLEVQYANGTKRIEVLASIMHSMQTKTLTQAAKQRVGPQTLNPKR